MSFDDHYDRGLELLLKMADVFVFSFASIGGAVILTGKSLVALVGWLFRRDP